jgi:uncharacterized protein YkwD
MRCLSNLLRGMIIGLGLAAGLSVPGLAQEIPIPPPAPTPRVQLDTPLRFTKPLSDKPKLAPRPLTSGGLTVDIGSRSAVVAFYFTVYVPTLAVPANWTGAVGGCLPGDTDQAYKDATLQMVNYFRAMAGLPGDVVFDPALNAKCQQAALMMIAQGSLSHSPPPTWTCYTADGANAAANSNLGLGNAGPQAVADGYIGDSGSNNLAVGHRRWVLYPPQQTMGTGSTTAVNGFFHGSNALFVTDNVFGPRPASPEWVVWPPAGYVPFAVVYPRWSFSLQDADFSGAIVTMTQGANNITVNVVSRDSVTNQAPDNTIVWEPQGLPTSAPNPDLTYVVHVDNVMVAAQSRSFSYSVTIIDPTVFRPENAVHNWLLYR